MTAEGTEWAAGWGEQVTTGKKGTLSGRRRFGIPVGVERRPWEKGVGRDFLERCWNAGLTSVS